MIKLLITGFIIIIGQFAFSNAIYGATSKESNRVAIIVNKYLKQEIEDNLNIYLQDLKNEGYEPILKEWDLENNPAPQALKAYLKGLYEGKQGLQGAVLIGDLPIPMMEPDPLLKTVEKDSASIQISNEYIAEKYYMDLVGKEWTDKDANFKFEEPHDETYWESFWKMIEYYEPEMLKNEIIKEDLYAIPEIWTSRIVTSTLTNLFKQSEGKLVNAYLEKNHKYRTGEVVFQKQTLLYSLPDIMKGDKAFSEGRFNKARSLLSKNYNLKEPIPAPATIDEFFKPLNNESYEIIYWGRHGMKTYIDLGSQNLKSDLLSKTLVNINTAIIFPASCWIGHYIEPAYFAGSYLFNYRYYALGMLTATLPTYGSDVADSMLSQFINGKNLGLAFKQAMEIPDFMVYQFDIQYFASNNASSNSRFILGDGTLKLQSKNLAVNEEASPQNYLKEKHSYNDEELIYDYVKLTGKSIPQLDDIKIVNKLFNIALTRDDYNMFDILIRKGADIKTQDAEGNTFLHLAAAKKTDNNLINFFIESGLDVQAINKHDKTPWDVAKENGNNIAMFDSVVKNGTIEQIKYLMANFADINAKNKDSYDDTPLHTAARRGDVEITKLLIENGADVNATSTDQSTPLLNANNEAVIELLLQQGADINAKNYLGNTKLHIAAAYGQADIVKFLIENGADINIKNNSNQTPLDMANFSDRDEIIEILKNAGAKTKEEF